MHPTRDSEATETNDLNKIELLNTTRPLGSIDGLKFTLTEVDLTAEKLLVHLDVENLGMEAASDWPWYFGRRNLTIRLGLVMANGARENHIAIRAKEGAVSEENGCFRFPAFGLRGAFVMEFQARENREASFSISVNDQPLLAATNLQGKAGYQPF